MLIKLNTTHERDGTLFLNSPFLILDVYEHKSKLPERNQSKKKNLFLVLLCPYVYLYHVHRHRPFFFIIKKLFPQFIRNRLTSSIARTVE